MIQKPSSIRNSYRGTLKHLVTQIVIPALIGVLLVLVAAFIGWLASLV
ncbi:MAG: hypothetical protein JSW71_06740 [Gemmatimonadota bacterium]|nr:MAG: hypothetical protein JSW71_06740 [Gemmatimonadota bacterium]